MDRIDHTVTSGTFSLDDEIRDIENNVWIVGDDSECVIIDAPHDVAEIVRLIDGRRVLAILCTHAHDDHV
jgi:glyoxylase-like metal-dependent hydrolase (beta-lactamase superfamily II)